MTVASLLVIIILHSKYGSERNQAYLSLALAGVYSEAAISDVLDTFCRLSSNPFYKENNVLDNFVTLDMFLKFNFIPIITCTPF